MMPLAEREVIGIVRGRDFDGAGAEVAADPLVEHDGNLAIQERQAQLFAVEMEVALVFRDEWRRPYRRAWFQGAWWRR